ncbi:hypothetical protein B7R25_07650 [Subtercola boreus]|uniref:Acetone carboxylase n=1 Tax=Subtercola boreus TaxID=120213 RepID=A0A3E0WBY2_9MICO|nr:hypothetical protein B7R24_07580 [Subtercola boreus]RFA21754.1 hypothetical protein B7R23_07525 [Subtercola boreus]RFA27725.1 hypothetical protein B7R25_07650 [Subtercola boreus]
MGGSPLGGTPGAQECSRAGCRSEAVWSIGWRNPKIHAADRVKVWVACDEHVDFLREFLAARDFPLTVTALPS